MTICRDSCRPVYLTTTVTSPDGTPARRNSPPFSDSVLIGMPSTRISALRTYSLVAVLKTRPRTMPEPTPAWGREALAPAEDRRVMTWPSSLPIVSGVPAIRRRSAVRTSIVPFTAGVWTPFRSRAGATICTWPWRASSGMARTAGWAGMSKTRSCAKAGAAIASVTIDAPQARTE